MLQSVLVFTSSGLVLYSRQYGPREVQRMVGALLRSICALADRVVGARLELIELSATSVCVASIPDAGGLHCAVLLDRDAPRNVMLELGRSLGGRLLLAFADDFSGELEGAAGHSLGTYRAFAARLPQVFRECVRAALQAVVVTPGVDGAVMATDDGLLAEAVLAPDAPRELDDVAILASARPLLVAASDLMTTLGDGVVRLSLLLTGAQQQQQHQQQQHPHLHGGGGVGQHTASAVTAATRVLLWRMEGASLVLHARADVGEAAVGAVAGLHVAVLVQLAALGAALRRGGGGGGGGGSGWGGGELGAGVGGALVINADGDVEAPLGGRLAW